MFFKNETFFPGQNISLYLKKFILLHQCSGSKNEIWYALVVQTTPVPKVISLVKWEQEFGMFSAQKGPGISSSERPGLHCKKLTRLSWSGSAASRNGCSRDPWSHLLPSGLLGCTTGKAAACRSWHHHPKASAKERTVGEWGSRDSSISTN